MRVHFRRLSFPAATLLLGLAAAKGGAAQSFTASHAKVSLVAEGNSLQAGQSAWVGVLFDIEKGWHIYWVNPGRFRRSSPDTVAPSRGISSGRDSLACAAEAASEHRDRLRLRGTRAATRSPSSAAGYGAANPVTLTADVRYVICRDVCIPAKALAKLSIPSPNAGGAADRELFRAAFDNAPKAWPAGWKAQASENGGSFVLSLETGASESKAAFFPLEQDQIDNDAMQGLMPNARGVQIKLKKSDQLKQPIAALKGVVVLGPGRVFEVSAPVTAKK